MRRIVILAMLLLSGIGCTRYAGPLAVRQTGRPDALGPDGRPYSIEEQERRGRERYAIPDDSWRAGPRTYVEQPTPLGR